MESILPFDVTRTFFREEGEKVVERNWGGRESGGRTEVALLDKFSFFGFIDSFIAGNFCLVGPNLDRFGEKRGDRWPFLKKTPLSVKLRLV